MDELSFLLKAIFTYYLIVNYGVFFGLVLIYLFSQILRVIIKIVFKLERVNNLDIYFAGRTKREKFNLMGVFFFEDFNVEKIRQLIIEKAITKMKKLRKKLVYKFFGYFWKEVPLEEAIKRIKIIEKHNIKSDEDMMNYLQGEVNTHVDLMKDLAYEFQLIKYADDSGRGAMVIKLDHTFSDGLGAISVTLFMADNYDPELFPPIMRNGGKLPWYQFIIDCVTFPYYGILIFYQMLFAPCPDTPLRLTKNSSGESNIILSKPFELKSFAQIRKNWKISFNDLIMCVIARVIKRLSTLNKYSDIYQDLKNIKCAMLVGRKTVPDCVENIKINNEVNLIYYKLPLVDNIKTEHKKVAQETSNYLKNPSFWTAAITLANILAEYLPLKIIRLILDTFMKNVDLIISNVPGPTSTLYFAGSRLDKFISISSNSRARAFLLISSYDQKFNLLLSVEKESGIDKKELMDLFEEELAVLAKCN
jgi:hypothetical protein